MGGLQRPLARALALGQLLAFLIALTATTTTTLASQGISAPFSQSALNYLLLAALYSALHARARGGAWGLTQPWWAYALLSALDVLGNGCLVFAYRYTSLTSVTLLDSFTIPVAVVLSAVMLGARYRGGHYTGAAVCLTGLALLVLTDQSTGSGGSTGSSGGSSGGGGVGGDEGRTWLGDALVLLGATFYACCNVLAERLLGDVSVHELLAMQGLWGLAITCVIVLPLELPTLLAAHWTAAAALPFLGFGLAMFLFYSLVPYELQWGGAALLNLSLLASDLWTALARQLLFGGFQGNSLLFFSLSFLIVVAGIVIYSASGDVYGGSGGGEAAAGGGKLSAEGRPRRGQQAQQQLHRHEQLAGHEEAGEDWDEERQPLAAAALRSTTEHEAVVMCSEAEALGALQARPGDREEGQGRPLAQTQSLLAGGISSSSAGGSACGSALPAVQVLPGAQTAAERFSIESPPAAGHARPRRGG